MAADRTYFKLLDTVFTQGVWAANRTGEPALTVWVPPTMKYDLMTDGFPILRSKDVKYKSAFEEMLWMISGSTDVGNLTTKIWNANSSRDFLDKRNLGHYEVGDIGPGYGFQMRHAGAAYRGKDADYTGEGFDQLAEVVRKLKEEPESRQNVMSLWAPADINKMALPPCHHTTTFQVRDNYYLNAHMVQRSGDIGLGVPFNVIGYALLMHILAREVGLVPNVFAHTISDAHIYQSHVETLKLQRLRLVVLDDPVENSRPRPRLKITAPPGTPFDAIKLADLQLINYHPITEPLPTMRMAV